MTDKPLRKQEKNELSPDLDDKGLHSFYGMDGFGAAVHASRFDIKEEIQQIINLIRDEDPHISLSALRQFRSVLKDIVSVNGMLGRLEHKIVSTPEGEVTTKTLSTNALISQLRRNNEDQEEKGSYEVFDPIEGSKESTPEPDGGGGEQGSEPLP